MKQKQSYKKSVSRITRKEFISFYSSCTPGEWFSEKEMNSFSYPAYAGSLAGRYLIKKTIGDFINKYDKLREIEILNDRMGKPVISLGANIKQDIEMSGIKRIECSISHSKNYFTGMTILCF
jgi:phosphopantetheinyl transferase (holo-ACP synthase)